MFPNEFLGFILELFGGYGGRLWGLKTTTII